MPTVPQGQRVVRKWPVLDLGITPDVDQSSWRLHVDGAVDVPLTLTFADLLALPQVEDISDFHCVTTWSKLDMRWRGVRVSTLLTAAGLADDASHLMCHGYDGYTTNVSLAEAVKDDVLLVHSWEGAPLPSEHGGPVRMITPQLYAWKGSKWISRIEVLVGDRPGFWEQRGYSMTAYPWREDRYS
ncbi:MAG: sulfite oxidase-like oxidoreductase [Myxococcales bacterium]|nr:sulfite oxidase-like oxidoreductase [Myxococcales bacterium]